MAQIIWDMDMEADSLETWTLSDTTKTCKKSAENLTLLELDTVPLQVVRVVEEDASKRDNDTDPLCWSSEVTDKVESLLESVEAELAFQRKAMVQTQPEIPTQKDSNSILDEEVEEEDSLLVNVKPISVVTKAETNLISKSSPDEWLVDSLSESRVEQTPVAEIGYVENAADALLYDDEPDRLCGTTLNEAISVVEQGLGASKEQEAYVIVHHETTPTINVQVYAVCPHKAELEREEAEKEARRKVRETEDDREQTIDDKNINNIEDYSEEKVEEDIIQNIEKNNENNIDFDSEQNFEEDIEQNNEEDIEQTVEENHEQKLVEDIQNLQESNSEEIIEDETNFDQEQVLTPVSTEMEVGESLNESSDQSLVMENGQVEDLYSGGEDAEVVEDLHVNGMKDSSVEKVEEHLLALEENLDNVEEQVGVKMEIDSEKDVCNGKEVKLEEKHIKPANEPKQQRVGNNMATVPTNLNACPDHSSLTSSKDNSMHVIFGVALRSAPKPVDYDAMDVAKENEKPVNLGQEEILNAAENVQKKKKKKKVDGEKKKKTKKSTSELSPEPEGEDSEPVTPTRLTRSKSHHELHGNAPDYLSLPVTQIEIVDLHDSTSTPQTPKKRHFGDSSVPSMPSVKNLKETYCQVVAASSPRPKPQSPELSRSGIDIENRKASWNDLSLQEPPSKHYPKEKICTGVSVADLRRSFSDLTNMDNSSRAWTPSKTSSKSLRGSREDLSVLDDFSPLRKATSTPKLHKQIHTYEEKASFSRERVDIDYNKKIHVRSVDTAQVQRQFNKNVFPLYAALDQHEKAGDNEATKLCRLCQKQVFQMELIKAEKASWHKNCFRCKECSKQLTVDTYMSHEGVLYCKPHFKSLFQPKAVFDEEQPVRIRKPELIVRENQPVELDPDVVRSSDRPDYGLEELSNLDVKSRFSVFEKSRDDETLDRDLSRSPSMAGVKRSESILVKMAKFQAGKNLEGLSAEELNGLAHAEEEEDSSSDEEEVEGVIKSRKRKERPQSFASMGDLKHKWEKSAPTDTYARREELAEERKEELQKLRARLCAGRQVRLKEAYEQAVQSSETTPKSAEKKLDLEVDALTAKASSLKERFEKGEVEDHHKSKLVQEESDVFEAATAKQSRHLFKEMEAQNAGKQESIVLRRSQSQRIPQTPDEPKKFVREVSGEVVRASDSTEQVEVPTADLASRFRFFETYKDQQEKEKAHQPRKKIVIPRQEQPEQDTTDGEIVRDPNVVRADVKIEDEVKTNTASKMLSVFRQMERGVVEEKPLGPKPLKSFTPPPDYKEESESEEEEDEEDEEDGSEYEDEEEEEQEEDGVQHNEDELLQLAKEKAVAKNLRAKFEKWEVQMEQRENRVNVMASEEIQVSLDTAKNLKARFESMKSEIQSPEKPRARVNRFVELQESCAENCYTCGKRVYAMEKLEAASKIFHKSCFKCSKCSCVLRLETFTQNKGKLYCTPHFKQLFITKGNYDEGFGDEQLCKRWVNEKNKNGTAGAQNHTNGRSKTPEVDEWDVLEQELLEE